MHRIMIIEDDRDTCGELTLLLKNEGYLPLPVVDFTDISVAGQSFKLGGIRTENFEQYLWDVNGHGFILVVPDEAAQACPVSHKVYVAMTEEPVSEAQYLELEEILSSIKTGSGHWGSALSSGEWILYTKAQEEVEAASMTAMTVFPLYYLALVLTMTAATILTIQQLCETDRYRRQFELLQKLGMDRREMERALGGQFTVYYAMPAIPPLIMSLSFILNLAKAVEPGIMVGANSPLAVAGMVIGLFLLIYGIYILLAYTSLKRNVI